PNTYQINKLNYLQSRPKGPIRHTPHQPNIQNDQHNHNQPHNAEKVHWHTIEFSDIIATQRTDTI
ncbi:hypothetical protein MHK03_10615, partial [Corynebacterium simulans]|uniref:hypothetical protein n=1 Tax=Corynebacterium simulans TaxID=146827 RepID=UPI001EF257D4